MIYRFRRHFKALTPLLGGFLLLSLAIGASPTSAASRKKTQPETSPYEGWLISQSSNFAGTVLSEFTKNAVRMKIGRLGLVIITKAPEWKTFVYNENNKNYVEMPAGKFMSKFPMGGAARKGKNGESLILSKETGKTTKICGVNAKEYEVRRKLGVGSKVRPQDERITDLWVAIDITAPSVVSDLFCQQLNVPSQKGIPLKVTQKNLGKSVSVLETQEVKKQTFASTIFEPLKGYKKVDDEMQLIMDEGTDDILGPMESGPTPGPLAPKTAPIKH